MCPAIFGDGWDCYAAPADATAGYWDSGTVGFTLVAGRFSGSQAIQNAGNTAWLVKTTTTGTTDNNHHISCAFQQTAAISGTTLGMYLQLSDGATNQVCIVFRSDGAILLTSATPAGTVLATYTGAVTAASTWYQFEFEVVISNTVGRFRVRKLGNTSDDFDSGATLNTRPGANAQASKLTVGQNATVTSHVMDDLLWRSDTSSVTWASDIRCFTRRPASDAAVQWSRSGTGSLSQTVSGTIATSGITNNTMRLVSFTSLYTGSISSVTFVTNTGASGNMKFAIYADSSGQPGAVLGSGGPVATVAAGNNTATISPTVPVISGQRIWIAALDDTSAGSWSSVSGSTTGGTASATYATFPQANPVMATGTTSQPLILSSITYALPASNYALVQDPQQDAATTYVYSSNVGDSDLYGISSIATTPASIVAVTTRGYLQKSDAGTRNTAVQLKSASTTVTSGAPLTYSPTALNPADLLNVTLSGSNLIATASGSPSAVRGTTGLSAGKFYCEFTYNSPQSTTCGGLATSTASLSSMGNGGATGTIQCFAGFAIWINGSSSGTSLGSISSGQVVGMAVDLTAKLIWFRIAPSGNWNASGTADPATGAGGISYSVLGAGLLTLYPAIGLGGPSAQIVANFGATAFSGAVPSGFASGFGSTITGGGAALNTTFGWQYLTNTTDPATGAAWTAVGVANCAIGVIVTA